jgi:hypothetical protein
MIGCDIHPWMRCWVYVFEQPHFAVTDPMGKFRIANVPTGKHQLIVRQPDGGLSSEKSVDVVAGQISRIVFPFTPQDLKGL